MSDEVITRNYLEKLSFSELSRLADNYGIDVPENLDRRFLIAELLELNEENEEISEDMIISSNDGDSNEVFVFPKNYNETQIDCVLRNPVWLFIFWNISDSDSSLLKKTNDYNLMLRICSFEDEEASIPDEAFEINAVEKAQEQYFLLPAGKKFIKVELLYSVDGKINVLAFTPVIKIPQGSKLVNDLQSGFDSEFQPLVQLSDINSVITKQYTYHRHSFI
ncbi:MAG: DUF4912 domain-containing protein [Treponema sp.]|nr:DUF4912 domain-containing protein [Treponema sp.]